MDGQDEISDRCLSVRERSLQEKIVRMENQLQGYKSQLDILENQRQKLEERSLKMESALTKTKKELLEAKKEVLDKEIAEIQLSEKLKSMTLKADEFERLFLAESSKNRCSLERLEKILSKEETEKTHEAAQDKFEGLKEILNVVQEGFTAQVKVIFGKISEAENKFCGSLQEGRTSNFSNSAPDDDGEVNAKDFYPDAKFSNLGLADQSKAIFESTPLTSKQTSSPRSAKPLTQPSVKGPLKIDSSFFAGLSSSNSPERRVEEPEEPAISPTSPGRVRNDSNTSYTNSGTLGSSQITSSAINKSSPFPFTFGNPSPAAGSTTSPLFDKADLSKEVSDLVAKFTPKPGSWSCGAAKLPEGTESTGTQFHLPKDLIASCEPSSVSSSSESPFTLKISYSRTLSRSPFTVSVASQSSQSPFTMNNSPSAASGTTSAFFGGASPEPPMTSKPATTQPFVLAAFEIPAISSTSNQPSFTFGTSNSTGFSSFSSSKGQTELPSTKYHVTAHNQPESSFSFSTSTQTSDVSKQKLSCQQPSGSFQFGKLDSIPPLGGASPRTPNVNNLWHQLTPSIFQPSNSQPESSPQRPAGFSFGPQGGFCPSSTVDFSSCELLRLLAATKQQQDSAEQTSYSGGYDFIPYVVDQPSEVIPTQGGAKPLSGAIIEECENEYDVAGESEDSTDDSSTYSSTDPDEQEEYIRTSEVPPQKPPDQTTQAQPSFSPGQGKGVTTPEISAFVQPSAALPLRRFVVCKNPLKGSKKEECALVYEVRASIADREKATRLLLPHNFFNYAKRDPCPGCTGCGVVSKETVESNHKENKEAEITPDTSENATASGPGTFAGPVFGQLASFDQLTFSSVFQSSTRFWQTQNKDTHKPFQGAGTQLFSDLTEEAEGQRDDKLHFRPVTPLPEEIKVVTCEEGLEVLFSERAKLYRFDADSGQWKERGIGKIKLLRHPSSGRGRVLMRREQIKKLCANHNITAGMELKPNVGSDRSWVWYTSADYAEGEARPEKLAIKLKTPEIAEKFKQVFNDLKELSSSELSPETTKTEEKKETGCELYGQFISTFAPAPGVWSCEVCYVENKADDVTCVACSSAKPGASLQTGEETETATNASVVESVEPITFQDSNKPAAPTGFVFQPAGGKGVSSGQLFTIGRVDPSEDTGDDEIEISPRKFSSPSKQGVSPPQKPSFPSQGAHLIAQLGAGIPSKFTFSMVVSPGSTALQGKSPLSRASPVSPESPVRADDDGPHFEPIIPLPEKAECRTGEEGQKVLFRERCKLFRFDGDTSQWKERGIGDIKILRNSSSGKYRVLMRREQIFKVCANHMITAEMELKPFPNSDRAWLWTTLADFSEDAAAAETLAARFITSEVASRFKEEFDKVTHAIAGKSNSNKSPTNPGSAKNVSEGQKERTKRLQVASNVFMCKQMTSESNSDESKLTTSDQEEATPIVAQVATTATQNKPSFPFGSANVASMSFQSLAALSLNDTQFGKNTTDKSTGFAGAGSQLFAVRKTDEDGDGDTPEGDHDGPHFEPIIPLPDKIDVKTGDNEQVMFSHRAKLYRFVAEEKQWKDRGVGDIKLLRNNLTGKMRVLMRREQVLKLCANHQITTDMKLQPNAGSDRSWVWSTLADFSEEECRPESLAVRFKNEEIAKQFKEKFERCQEILKEQASEAANARRQGRIGRL